MGSSKIGSEISTLLKICEAHPNSFQYPLINYFDDCCSPDEEKNKCRSIDSFVGIVIKYVVSAPNAPLICMLTHRGILITKGNNLHLHITNSLIRSIHFFLSIHFPKYLHNTYSIALNTY